MRILRFDLAAYGPFTGRRLDFSGELPGLHLIHGPNEAGKSSALRGLRAWLYGFPERTADDFLHPYNQLLLTGVLEGADGSRLAFQRRKRRKDDLLDEQGHPLDPARLAAMLHNILPAVFDSLHGINHEGLVQGGEEILQQEGALGQALFATGGGLDSLRILQNSLTEEAESLYRPRGQKQTINQALAEHESLRRRIREQSISAPAFRELEERLETSLRELHGLELRRAELETEKRRWERLQHALPQLALRRNLRERLTELTDTPVLPEDFSRRRRECEGRLREALALRDEGTKQLAELHERSTALTLPRPLLERAPRIDDLVQRLGSHLKAQADRGKIIGLRSGDRSEAESLFKQLRPDIPLEQAEELRFLLGRRRSIEELLARHAALEHDKQQARQQLRRLAEETEEIRQQLTSLGPTEELSPWRVAVAQARQGGDIDTVLSRLERQEEQERTRWSKDLASLGRWSGSPARSLELPLPLNETLRQAEQHRQQLERHRQELQGQSDATHEALARLEVELTELCAAGSVPDEEELHRTRRERDQGWALIKRQWLGQEDVAAASRRYDPARPLHEAFAERMAAADELGDRLRREAERVQRMARLQGELREQHAKDKKLGEEEQLRYNRQRCWEQEWQTIWQPTGIEPLGPAEMLSWLADFRELRQRAAELERLQREITHYREERQRLRQGLAEALSALGRNDLPAGDLLAPLLQWAATELERREATAQQRRSLEERQRDLARRQHELAAEEEARTEGLASWQRLWLEQTEPLTGKRPLAPAEAGDALDLLQKCLNKMDLVKGHDKRIEGIDRDARALERDTVQLAGELLPEQQDQGCILLLPILHKLLTEARRSETREQELHRAAGALEKRLRDGELAIGVLRAELAELCRLAGCGQDGELDAIEQRYAERRELQRRLEECEAALLNNTGGQGIEALEALLATVEVDRLPELIASDEREIASELSPRARHLAETIGKLQQELAQLREQQGAAGLAAEAAALAAVLRQQCRRYLRVRAAAAVLALEIERYRVAHQGPLLRLASEYFRRLTREAYQGLRADEDDTGRPVLTGLRGGVAPIERQVAVGHMSSGTRDQLYLALRLAALSHRQETEEPMPLIVDDILVNFDDDRSLATLEVLADLARRTQVILFTHHRRLWQQAEGLDHDAPSTIHLHDLALPS
ncbi:MAG: hypothetical protein BWK76_02810 [Desulfobulbaceae bacterium A2]|nr:MAG: hypothetical protein BWK76_02810 [Desulfobulbaceae bacterium A2]